MPHGLTPLPEPSACYSPHPDCARPLLFVVEGILDVQFLSLLSGQLRATCPDIPDLGELSARGRLVFIPAGGGDLSAWVTRLAPLGCREFVLFDREQPPETALRQVVVAQINARPGCIATLTKKRALENYFHPAAIEAATGLRIDVDDESAVAEALVCARPEIAAAWPTLSRRTRQRLLNRVKRLLATVAVRHMTAELLAERDPAGEVLGWFRALATLLRA